MSQDFVGNPATSTGDGQGEAAESGQTDGKPARLDLQQTPEWRAAQSSYDRQIAQRDQRIRELDRNLSILNRQMQAIQHAASEDEPTMEFLAQEAQIAAQEEELAYLRQQEQLRRQQEDQTRAYQEWQQAWINAALQEGVDPNDHRYQAALQTADGARVGAALGRLIAEKPPAGQGQSSPSALPPTGGHPASQQALVDEFRKKKHALPPGDLAKLLQLRQAYRGKIPDEELGY